MHQCLTSGEKEQPPPKTKKTMKKDKFTEIWYSVDGHERQSFGDFEVVGLPSDTFRLIGWFDIESLPTIATTAFPHGGYYDALSMSPNYTLDLSRFKEQLQALEKDEIFSFGRDACCDHRWGFEEFLRYEKEGKLTAEYAYMRMARNISRIHCIILKVDNIYALYDCSTAGTCIKMKKSPAPAPAPRKRHWWQIF